MRVFALCLVLPSHREGYGLVVVETLSKGTPVVLVRGEDNAALELISEGENGFIAASASADDLAAAIVRVIKAGPELRTSALQAFKERAVRLSLHGSLERVSTAYDDYAALRGRVQTRPLAEGHAEPEELRNASISGYLVAVGCRVGPADPRPVIHGWSVFVDVCASRRSFFLCLLTEPLFQRLGAVDVHPSAPLRLPTVRNLSDISYIFVPLSAG